ncbi:MAG: HAD hydrolase family protein [Clostridiales bacterium]|nr:HAD hydrolase family protein [Clostridiales bacterium]
MILFNSDLDNTLIYSYKREIGDDKCCVEIYQEREISFMTKTSYQLLQKVNKGVCFVPTTTRTVEQYERIDLGIGTPKYALVCNGGKLLVDGVNDESWYQESRERIQECDEVMQQAIRILECDPHRTFEIRYIDQLFIFTKSDAPDDSIAYLKSNLDMSKVDVFKTGIKVYVTPKMLTKGNAVLRLKEKLKSEKVIAAGDSEFDLSMLQVADIAFAPVELIKHMKQDVHFKSNYSKLDQHPNLIAHDGEGIFSERILQSIVDRCN